MSVRFQSLPDDVVPAALTPIDEDFVDLVVTKLLGNNASLPTWIFDFPYEQHEPNSLHFDEDFYQQFIVWATQSNARPIITNDDLAALFCDEDFWNVYTAQTVPQSFRQPSNVNEDIFTPVIPLDTDELYWQNPVFPVTIPNATPDYSKFEDHFDAHQVLFATPDEDFWVNPVFQAAQPFQVSQQWSFQQDQPEPAGSLYGEPDEDFWSNPVFPVTIPNLAPNPALFEQHDPGALHSSVDEDFWANPAFPVTVPNLAPQQWTFEQHESAGSLYGNYDNEDQWINWTLPVTIPNLRLDQSNFSQGEEAIDLYGAFEDDSFFPLPYPAQALLLWPQPFLGDDESGTVFQAYLDDPFVVPFPAQATEWQYLPVLFDAVETVIQIPYQGTEDYAVAQPQSLPVLAVIPFWPWQFEASNDYKYVVIKGRTYIYWIG